MGLAQDAHAAVTRYEDAARASSLAAVDLASTVAEIAESVAAHGPLGASADPDLVRARARLDTARQRLLEAGEAVEAARSAARGYVDRVFPR